MDPRGKLSIDIEKIPLKDIGVAWERKTIGQRPVIVPSSEGRYPCQ